MHIFSLRVLGGVPLFLKFSTFNYSILVFSFNCLCVLFSFICFQLVGYFFLIVRMFLFLVELVLR